jgi:hypothetical protein
MSVTAFAWGMEAGSVEMFDRRRNTRDLLQSKDLEIREGDYLQSQG